MPLTLVALALMVSCVVVETAGIIFLIRRLARVRHILALRSAYRRGALLLGLFLAVILLHLAQIGLWAVAFWEARQLPDFETALYFSLASYTTIGFGDVVLGPGWRVLAGLEGLTGLVLVGWSTAFTFAVVSRMYEYWRERHERDDGAR